jgi:hypothetical protein
VLFQFIDPRAHLVVDKLASSFGNHAMLFGEVFRGEDFVGRPLLNQEGSTFDYLFLLDYG